MIGPDTFHAYIDIEYQFWAGTKNEIIGNLISHFYCRMLRTVAKRAARLTARQLASATEG